MNGVLSPYSQIKSTWSVTEPELSFEFYPARNAKMENTLWRAMGQLELLNPAFFSMTYGALGSVRDDSINAVATMSQHQSVPVAAHLTAAGHSQEYMLDLARGFYEKGVQRIVALRGDAEPTAEGISDVGLMIRSLKEVADFDISVAAYPEVHPKAASAEADLQHLIYKLDSGANRAITQYFFEADVFLRFRDKAAKAGIYQPIVPGILPVHDLSKVESFSARCGASVPESLKSRFAGTQAGSDEQRKIGIEHALDLCETLLAEGVENLHFYTLNMPNMSFEVAKHLVPEPVVAMRESKAA